MSNTATRLNGGIHRKFSTAQIAKRRIALVAVAAGAVSTAGVGGAAAATVQQNTEVASEASATEIALVNESMPVTPSFGASPQVLEIAEFKPAANVNEQLVKAVDYEAERIATDLAARVPAVTGLLDQGNQVGATVVRPAEGTFTSGFGPRWGTMHAGIDIANAVGTPIYAVMAGTVIDSGPASGYGNWIRIQHDDGSMSVYGHMSSLNVAVGQRVSAGAQIAGMGNEGFSTGSHLHFEIHPSGSGAVDPVPWFAERGINF